MYLGLAFVYLGIAIAGQSVWALIRLSDGPRDRFSRQSRAIFIDVRSAARSRGSLSMLAWILGATRGSLDCSSTVPRLSGRTKPGLIDQVFAAAWRLVTSERYGASMFQMCRSGVSSSGLLLMSRLASAELLRMGSCSWASHSPAAMIG